VALKVFHRRPPCRVAPSNNARPQSPRFARDSRGPACSLGPRCARGQCSEAAVVAESAWYARLSAVRYVRWQQKAEEWNTYS
jgi:hypothetical protein